MKNQKIFEYQIVKFECYKQGCLWFSVNGFRFYVPIEDLNEEKLKGTNKNRFYMKYMRKHMLLLKDLENIS